jgi:ABC-type nitrate/sulfonate/bicarbonate transport system permease component
MTIRAENRALVSRLSGVLLIASLLLLWQISAVYWIDSPNWPPVTEIFLAIKVGLQSGELLEIFGSSLYRMTIGYCLGTLAALAVGLLIANVRILHAALNPLIELVRPVPVPAIIPPLILLLGVDDLLKIFIISFTTFFPILVNTVSGIRAVDPVLIDVARTLRVGRLRTIFSIVVPASLPYILAGMRISLALALIVTIVAEMIAGSGGLGYYLTMMQYAMRASDMYAAILLLALVGYALNWFFLIAERALLFRRSNSE